MNWKKIFYLALFFCLFSCKKNENQIVNSWIKISENVQYLEKEDQFLLKSGKFSYSFKKNELPFSKIILLNNSLLGYFLELGQEQKIIGVSGVQYIYSQRVINLLDKGIIKNVGTDQKYDLEKIIALNPEVIFTNYMPAFEKSYEILQKNGIKIIFLDEYLEQNPLEKTAYVKLFGKLLGAEKQAEKIYTEVEKNYNDLKFKTQKIEKRPKVLVNEMFGNQWFMAGGRTFTANYLKDAGADYILSENPAKKSVPMSFEEVFAKSKNAEFWVNAGNYNTKKELLVMNPIYEKMEVFQKGKIYTMNRRKNGSANDIFESGAVRADLVLKDYIKIFHPEILPEDTLFYMKELK